MLQICFNGSKNDLTFDFRKYFNENSIAIYKFDVIYLFME